MSRPFKLMGAAQTDVGRVREHNEDSVLARPDLGVWVVADGMGGHEHGEWASAAIVEAVGALTPHADFDAMVDAAAEAIHEANAVVYREGAARGATMGSTVVAAVLGSGRFAILWAGDSRAYLLRDGVLHRLSVDHTQVQVLVDGGLLTQEEAESHPLGHVLSRAVGVTDRLLLDAIADTAAGDDILLLCSDGLTGVVSDAEIAAMLRPGDPAGSVRSMIDLCLSRGAPDNVTIVAVEVCEPTALLVGEESSLP